MREYERFSTVAANAYIKPMMKSYLIRLEDQLRQQGVDCPIFMMHSGGGIISIESAAEFPVRLVESGRQAVQCSPPTSRHAMVSTRCCHLTWAEPQPRYA